jgi:ribosome-binding factor A
MNPRKKRRIEQLLRRELSNIVLYELKDPRTGFVTLTRVELAEDQRSAKVHLTVRGPAEQTERTLAALHHARGYMQGLIADRLKLRWTPVLTFGEDKDIREAMRIEKLIDQTLEEDRQHEV